MQVKTEHSIIKMVVTDLDGTLFRTDKAISRYTVDTLQMVRNIGIKIIFATSRAFCDDINDKEMFSNCGLSVAMDNAIDEIKK